MPLIIDETDVSILKSLLEDGKKSFRRMSKAHGNNNPNRKSQYESSVGIMRISTWV